MDKTEAQKLDILGNQIACSGSWCGSSLTQFEAAISINHLAHGHDETYKSKCDLCLETFELLTVAEKSNFNGCIYHLGFNVNFRKTVALEV